MNRRFDDRDPTLPIGILLAAIGVMLMLIVGRMDYQDAEREHAHYCEMVQAGHWPDYKKLDEQGECDE